MAIPRNQPCPCGSGQKYKNCCQGKERDTSKGLITLLVVLALIAGAGGVATTFLKRETRNRPNAQFPQGGRPQPGPAPAGKVWSAEHGHWHDAAPGGAQPVQAQAQQRPVPQTPPATPGPQPPGPVPPGKVWSTEHGHWHDAPK